MKLHCMMRVVSKILDYNNEQIHFDWITAQSIIIFCSFCLRHCPRFSALGIQRNRASARHHYPAATCSLSFGYSWVPQLCENATAWSNERRSDDFTKMVADCCRISKTFLGVLCRDMGRGLHIVRIIAALS